MSTSEDSFGWATTSSDTDSMSSDENIHNGDVSASEECSKEKLQKKLIKENYQNMNNVSSSDISKSESEKRTKKRKIKEVSDDSTIHSPKKKKIKSDPDQLIIKKERKNSLQQTSNEIAFDDNKSEQSESTIHSPEKKKIKSDENIHNGDVSASEECSNEKLQKKLIKENYQNMNNVSSSDISKSESEKRTKKRKIKEVSDDSTIHSPKKKKIKSDPDQLIIKKERKNSLQQTSNEIAFDDNKSEQSEKFDSQTDTKGQLTLGEKYRNAHKRMKAVKAMLPENSIITPDDDIWVMKCPKEIDIKSLEGINLVLDYKFKIKINEQTYEGRLDEDNTKIPILSCKPSQNHNSMFFLDSITPNGVIQVKKRLKSHKNAYNDTDHCHDSIPLHKYKCRHPLFGSNYLPFLNPQENVSVKLEKPESPSEQTVDNTYIKKKEKKKKRIKIEMEEPVRKNKSKHKDHEHNSSKLSTKKSKRPSDVTEVWESEKAIEENLFNF